MLGPVDFQQLEEIKLYLQIELSASTALAYKEIFPEISEISMAVRERFSGSHFTAIDFKTCLYLYRCHIVVV